MGKHGYGRRSRYVDEKDQARVDAFHPGGEFITVERVETLEQRLARLEHEFLDVELERVLTQHGSSSQFSRAMQITLLREKLRK